MASSRKNRWLKEGRHEIFETCPECKRSLPATAFLKNYMVRDSPNCAACDSEKDRIKLKRDMHERKLFRLEVRRRRYLRWKVKRFWKWKREKFKYGRKKRREEGNDLGQLFKR